jgi:dTDP-L-rhamnose 4-epimerase
MSKKILITGGAGFIGSHLSDLLLTRGYDVCILDNLSPQVHGSTECKPSYLKPDIEFFRGDIRDSSIVQKALAGVNSVFHFAAAVGVGQSMYQIQKYTDTNNSGTAVLLENMIGKDIEKLIVASSMSIYGEGLYRTGDGFFHNNVMRTSEQLKIGNWNPIDDCGNELEPVATPENKSPSIESLYALSKYDQEKMCLMIGKAYNIPAVALRFFNVYGSRQALSNPYTGVLAIFASRYLNNKPPVIFEDGSQRRDFVSVYDVCSACCLALENENAANKVFNIGSGCSCTIKELSSKMANVLCKEKVEHFVNGKYRMGDIRHCFADITLATSTLGYTPVVSLEKGLIEFASWLEGQIPIDKLDIANAELYVRGLAV